MAVVNVGEARVVAAAQLEALRAEAYEDLRRRLLNRQETGEVVGPSGGRYQVERHACSDGRGDNLRVMVAVDDGGFRSFAPVEDDFIISPDGSFVGE